MGRNAPNDPEVTPAISGCVGYVYPHYLCPIPHLDGMIWYRHGGKTEVIQNKFCHVLSCFIYGQWT